MATRIMKNVFVLVGFALLSKSNLLFVSKRWRVAVPVFLFFCVLPHIGSAQSTNLPIITTEPLGQFVWPGATAVFSVTATNPSLSTHAISGPSPDTNIVSTGDHTGTVAIDYDFFQVPDTMHV